ncbi:extracellular superoxide dismutase [Cu-Zn]-like [Culicoides brevitarsis]|uniref:extracellular superoxide dismutase [Cu-Zn]-like n=1 Tax=Culicoides brevitarsis TaxID=469753 RepID=UPI00307CA306
MNKLLPILSVIASFGFITATGQFFGDFDVSNGQPIHLVPVYNPNSGHFAPQAAQYAQPQYQTHDFGGYEDYRPVITCGPNNGPISAIAVLKSETVSGNVTLTQKSCNDPLHVEVSFTGLSPGYHGFHVHEKGDLSGGCLSTGGHYNPDKVEHGDIHDTIRHVGDWANVEANAEGIVNVAFDDKVATLFGERSILGRAIVVHEKIDDLGQGGHPDSKKTGNAGGRLACGVIGILEPYEGGWPGSGASSMVSWRILTFFAAFVAFFVRC